MFDCFSIEGLSFLLFSLHQLQSKQIINLFAWKSSSRCQFFHSLNLYNFKPFSNANQSLDSRGKTTTRQEERPIFTLSLRDRTRFLKLLTTRRYKNCSNVFTSSTKQNSLRSSVGEPCTTRLFIFLPSSFFIFFFAFGIWVN